MQKTANSRPLFSSPNLTRNCPVGQINHAAVCLCLKSCSSSEVKGCCTHVCMCVLYVQWYSGLYAFLTSRICTGWCPRIWLAVALPLVPHHCVAVKASGPPKLTITLDVYITSKQTSKQKYVHTIHACIRHKSARNFHFSCCSER